MIEIVDQKITNADKIRNMTDVELLSVIRCPALIDAKDFIESPTCAIEECDGCKLRWLQQEVKQEEINGKDM